MRILAFFFVYCSLVRIAHAQLQTYPIRTFFSIENNVLLPSLKGTETAKQENAFCISLPKIENKLIDCEDPADNLQANISYAPYTSTATVQFEFWNQTLNFEKYKGQPIGGGYFYVVPRKDLAKKITTEKLMWVSFTFIYPAEKCPQYVEFNNARFTISFQAGKRVEYIFDECFNYTIKVTNLPKETIKYHIFQY